jgi:hypothetical protein
MRTSVALIDDSRAVMIVPVIARRAAARVEDGVERISARVHRTTA